MPVGLFNFRVDFSTGLNGTNWNFSLVNPSRNNSTLPSEAVLPEDQSDCRVAAVKLATWLEQLARAFQTIPGEEAQYRLVFTDAVIQSEECKFLEWYNPPPFPNNYLAAAVFYQAVCLYLGSQDRNNELDARGLYLFAAWQTYNLLKSVTRDASLRNKHRYIFGSAHHRLADILENPEYSEAVRWLAYGRFQSLAQPVNGREVYDPNDKLLRKRLRRSLILLYKSEEITDNRKDTLTMSGGEEVEIYKPLNAPGAFREDEKIWEKAHLHPAFRTPSSRPRPEIMFPSPVIMPQSGTTSWINLITDRFYQLWNKLFPPTGNQAIAALVNDWLLPHYDYESSFQLASMMRTCKEDHCNYRWKLTKWLYHLLPFSFILLLSMIYLTNWLLYRSIDQPMFQLMKPAACAVVAAQLVVLFLWNICLPFWTFDRSILLNLMLPRLLGGITLGYTILLTQQDAINLVDIFQSVKVTQPRYCAGANTPITIWAHIFSQEGILVALLWISVIAIGYIYISKDVQPWTGNPEKTLQRTITTLLLAVSASLIIGTGMSAMSSAAYRPAESCWAFLLGPFGWMEAKQWLVFAPFALFAGLVTQFLFEERTLPYSVWAPKQD